MFRFAFWTYPVGKIRFGALRDVTLHGSPIPAVFTNFLAVATNREDSSERVYFRLVFLHLFPMPDMPHPEHDSTKTKNPQEDVTHAQHYHLRTSYCPQW